MVFRDEKNLNKNKESFYSFTIYHQNSVDIYQISKLYEYLLKFLAIPINGPPISESILRN